MRTTTIKIKKQTISFRRTDIRRAWETLLRERGVKCDSEDVHSKELIFPDQSLTIKETPSFVLEAFLREYKIDAVITTGT